MSAVWPALNRLLVAWPQLQLAGNHDDGNKFMIKSFRGYLLPNELVGADDDLEVSARALYLTVSSTLPPAAYYV